MGSWVFSFKLYNNKEWYGPPVGGAPLQTFMMMIYETVGEIAINEITITHAIVKKSNIY